jgi:hypothetical protein
MALTAAQKQKRYRDRRKAEDQMSSDTIERALLLEVERSDQLSDQERMALADKLADLAMDLLHRATKLSKLAQSLRPWAQR